MREIMDALTLIPHPPLQKTLQSNYFYVYSIQFGLGFLGKYGSGVLVLELKAEGV